MYNLIIYCIRKQNGVFILQLFITDGMIRQQATNEAVYQRGIIYYLQKRVAYFEFDDEDLTVDAEVIGMEEYDVTISFFRNGQIDDLYCTCPAFRDYSGACKHIVAVLKRTQQEFQMQNMYEKQNLNMVDYIFDFFEVFRENKTKEEVNLEIIYELENGYNGRLSSLELRIGMDRLYVVKNTRQFLESIIKNKPLTFGKKFIFDPLIHTFKEQDREIIQLLREIYEHQKMLEDSFATSSSYASVLKGKKIYLSSSAVKRLFKTLNNRFFKAIVLGKESEFTTIKEKDLPLSFELKQKNEKLLLDLKQKHTFIPITQDGEYFFYQGSIYHISEKQQTYFFPFYNGFMRNRERAIIFSGKDKEKFVSELLPRIKNIAKVDIDKAVEESLYHEDLQIKIYFDKAGEGISAKVEFCYGAEIINPFIGKQIPSKNNKILVRDAEKEKNILAVFEQSAFTVQQGILYLENEDSIFEFVYHILPKLQEHAEIFYSDAFKNITIKDPSTFSAGVRLAENTNMLEFSFHHEDIPNEELEHIFASIQEKKKYHRLKDGSFIPLHIPELEQMAELMENLDISAKDLNQKVLRLPKYRAMYIDSCLRESNLQHVERNLAFKQLVQNVREPEDMEFKIPEELQTILRDYQKKGFKWLKTLVAYGLGGILADDMGLGKTLQVIAFVLSEQEKKPGPSLVITPTSLVYNWQEEIRKFVPHMKAVVISGTKQERREQLQKVKDVDFIITSYPLIRRDIEMYSEMEFAYCFLDEAQHIKNPNTINAQSVKQVRAKGYFALTGTPIENSLTELWSIFDFIMPGYLFSHTKFIKKFESPIMKNQDKQKLKELSRQIAPFVLRRMKEDVLKELPQKIESKMTAELTPEQKKIYMAYLHQAKGEIAKEIAEKGFEKSHIKILSVLTRLRQICCHPSLFIENYRGESGKMLLLQEVLEDAIESGHRILLFSQFTSMLHIIKKHLDSQNIQYFYLDGSTEAKVRGETVRNFNEGERDVFLISLKAGGTGLNLTGADMVIHFDPWWNPAVEDQATDRAYRIGQKNAVQVMKFITRGTIEEKIYALQQKKKEMIESIIQPGETLLTKMSEEEIKALFE